ncbi:MAG: histidine phosphatase family protein [bacterium]|nr:histidine phosphatase family protein [bacterium]
MELILIRHGLPLRIENEDGRPADPPLSGVGRQQAERVADWLESEQIDALYTSPLKRAFETAQPLARLKGLSLRVEAGVAEMDQHADTYIPLEQLKASDYDAWKEAVQGGLYAAIDLPAFQRTVIESIEGIIAAHPRQRVAVSCHGGVINTWAGHVMNVVGNPMFFDPTYTSINRFLAASSGERSVVTLNEHAHLRD